MSAQDIEIVTIIVPNPQYDNSNNAQVVSSNLGYSIRISNNFVNLAPNNPNGYDIIEGLFYVPTLDSSFNATCKEALSLVPSNVTTLASFPHQDYPLIALFPWTTSSECTDAYLTQSRTDAVRGAIVYQLTGDQPPPSTDSSWLLNGSEAWTSENQYGIYGISPVTGAAFMTQLALYSGNMTSVPDGVSLAQQYDGRDFPRLFAQVELAGQPNTPSLWVFLIIVLAVLLGIVILASIIMHLIQRRQRTVLQRRLERGEVDLETLGIKKMNVPQEKIDEMPKYIFSGDTAVTIVPSSPSKSTRITSTVPQPSFSQTLCPICLDDFVGGETEVRELPCKHIFHPECIDLFLRDSSSLCPMCKKSALPAGYCPVKVTNLMVRRERLVRRMRERRRLGINPAVNGGGRASSRATTKVQYAWLWIQKKLRIGDGLPATPAPNAEQLSEMRERRRSTTTSISAAAAANGDLEMGPTTTTVERSSLQPSRSGPSPLQERRQTIAVPPEIAAQGAAARRAWRRERLARQQEQAYDQQAQTVREVDEARPFWRRVVGRLAPGIA